MVRGHDRQLSQQVWVDIMLGVFLAGNLGLCRWLGGVLVIAVV